MGVAGAYSALSDDPAGIAYNPAGMAFASSDNLSASVNLFLLKRTRVEKFFSGRDFNKTTSDIIPSFAGGLHKLDWLGEGLVGAFGIYTSDYEFVDQVIDVPDGQIAFAGQSSLVPLRYHSEMKAIGKSTHLAGSLAVLVSESTSVGLTSEIVISNESRQSFTDYRIGPLPNAKDVTKPLYFFVTGNDYTEFKSTALGFRLGALHKFSNFFQMGFSLLSENLLSQRQFFVINSIDLVGKENGDVFTSDEVNASEESLSPRRRRDEAKNMHATGPWRGELRFGMAVFPVLDTTISADVVYNTANSGDVDAYDRVAVVNFSTGVEQRFSEEFRLSAGYFTNKDSKKKSTASNDALIDYHGLTALGSLVFGSSRYNLGFAYQKGEGRALGILGTGGAHTEGDILGTVFSISTAF